MGKLRVLSGADACAILTENGFEKARQEGSHVSMQKILPGTTLTVPVPLHEELAKGTLSKIIKLSGLPRNLFEVH